MMGMAPSRLIGFGSSASQEYAYETLGTQFPLTQSIYIQNNYPNIPSENLQSSYPALDFGESTEPDEEDGAIYMAESFYLLPEAFFEDEEILKDALQDCFVENDNIWLPADFPEHGQIPELDFAAILANYG